MVELCSMSWVHLILLCIVLLLHSVGYAQPVDTLGVTSDTTLIAVPEPFERDTVIADDGNGPIPQTGETDPISSPKPGRRDTLTWRERHSPRKAIILSALLPGAGQIYNRKYWKAPIVWAGIGISYRFIQENTTEYQRYRTAYLALVDDDPSTIDEFEGQYTPRQVREVMETYQRWRDISYIAIGAVYILNIVDASVDAHFVRFDVSPDLSLHLGPSLPLAGQAACGLSLRLAVR